MGQFKTPFAWEYLTSIADIETLDRSTVVDSLAPKRDIGVMADYQAGKYVLFSAGVFNGEGINTTSNKDSTVLGMARAAIKPIPSITIGVNFARWFGDSLRYGFDAAYQDTRFLARGEYIGGARDSLDARDDWGWYGVVGFKPTPKVQLIAKYEDFRREVISPQFKNRAYSSGINTYPVIPSARLSAFYRAGLAIRNPEGRAADAVAGEVLMDGQTDRPAWVRRVTHGKTVRDGRDQSAVRGYPMCGHLWWLSFTPRPSRPSRPSKHPTLRCTMPPPSANVPASSARWAS